MTRHNGRFYVYIPARTPTYHSNYVIHSEKITGPWSEPVDLKLPHHIDPGHVVGEDGKRYLFLSGGDRVGGTAGPPTGHMVIAARSRSIYGPWENAPRNPLVRTRAGLLLFYSRRLYCGLGFDQDSFVMHRYGLERRHAKPAGVGRRLRIRIRNDRHIYLRCRRGRGSHPRGPLQGFVIAKASDCRPFDSRPLAQGRCWDKRVSAQ